MRNAHIGIQKVCVIAHIWHFLRNNPKPRHCRGFPGAGNRASYPDSNHMRNVCVRSISFKRGCKRVISTALERQGARLRHRTTTPSSCLAFNGLVARHKAVYWLRPANAQVIKTRCFIPLFLHDYAQKGYKRQISPFVILLKPENDCKQGIS